ncbi:hypothetical protein QL285_060544 [Trifolium repens]|nr:hypothetical protein QL285_060544 [Trifolium repens]
MESFPLDVGKTFVEKWITGAIEKSRYLFCFKSIAEEFNKEKEKLEADRKTMRQRFRVAIEKDKDRIFHLMLNFGKSRLRSSFKRTLRQIKDVFSDFAPIAYGDIKEERSWQTRYGKLKNWWKRERILKILNSLVVRRM